MECDHPISILLIGSTGNGKSSLGNFLLDPSDEHIRRKKTFQTGTTNKPATKALEYAYDRERNPSLRVIDTPGLNEGIEEDHLHMGQVLQSVKELKSITACVFCIKFNSRIDVQYKNTIKYYKKLEPKLFERNVVIVLTNFKTDKHSVSMRETQRVNVDDVKFNTQRDIVKSAELSYYPKVFKIDSLPMSEEDRRTSESCRSSLLDYIKHKFRPLSILLIGSTGSGKSSLGNFLLDPPSDEHIKDKKAIFCTGRTSFPETQRVQYAYDRDVHPSLLVIDTPGLNESASKDLSHIIDLVKMLQELKAITACVFCIKFDSKIDAQFKDTVASYHKLLPSLFEGNVIIALTNFQTDGRSVEKRVKIGVDVDDIVRNTQEEIVDSVNLTFIPPVFLIDSFPLSNDERRTSLSCCSSMLDYIKQCLRPICTKELQVAKTQLLKELDEKEINQLDDEIFMENMHLKEVNEKVERVLDEIEQAQKQVTELRGEIRSIKAELHEKDSETMVTAKTWNLQPSYKRYRSQPLAESFEITAKYPIVDYTRWDNGHLTWKEFQWSRDPGRANGKVESKRSRNLHATVNLLTKKRIKYKKDIEICKAKLSKKEEELEVVMNSIHKLEEKHPLEIKHLNNYIESRNERKEDLLTDLISIEEADKRLDELNTRH